MMAVWSYWSAPTLSNSHSVWTEKKYEYLAWILSFERARKLFDSTCLVTDDEGRRALVDGLGLTFTHVSTELNEIRPVPLRWWMIGKLYTYAAMKEPFIHIDSDVFLWKKPPSWLFDAPVFAQSPETEQWYNHEKYPYFARSGGWVPEPLTWFPKAPILRQIPCCGIFGGNNIKFINHYARDAIRLIEHENNKALWDESGIDNPLAEQYVLAAYAAYYRNRTDHSYGDTNIWYLFYSSSDAFNPNVAFQKGYTHLLAGTKRNPSLIKGLEERVEREYPEHYKRALRLIS